MASTSISSSKESLNLLITRDSNNNKHGFFSRYREILNCGSEYIFKGYVFASLWIEIFSCNDQTNLIWYPWNSQRSSILLFNIFHHEIWIHWEKFFLMKNLSVQVYSLIIFISININQLQLPFVNGNIFWNPVLLDMLINLQHVRYCWNQVEYWCSASGRL